MLIAKLKKTLQIEAFIKNVTKQERINNNTNNEQAGIIDILCK